ncbi:MAG: 2-oxo-4-hydroxy-4-carboxy-5-ureidoimidazoline decarboxylase [Burkholderiaceae bacterium]|nr:2-oxo-4-hydroxy-4-carboxy-5-ureidoimidazoline decarboxylase [Burkholderiaceae bacterium]
MNPSTTPSLALLSQADCDSFTAQLGDIFEHSPWVATAAWAQRPFSTVDALHQAMVAAVLAASHDQQLALIQAHPELAGKEAASGTLTNASTAEQRGAGLDQCSNDELARLRALNAAYRTHFGFPFVIAVKGLSRYQIMDAINARLENDAATEFQTSLLEIGKIGRFRLDALLG